MSSIFEESNNINGPNGGEGDQDDSDSESSEEEVSWIAWFVNLRGNEFFAEVDEDYIQDDFNLTNLNTMVPYYDLALDLILDADTDIDTMPEDKQEIVETAAEVLYGLIHARYILTSKGMLYMYEKFQSADFGRCPRTYCQGQPVLPVGLSDLPRNYSVNVFCPRCQEIYYPRSSKHANIDGAYFGTTFSNLFLLQNPDLIPPTPQQAYVPRIYGFRINSESLFYSKREASSTPSSSPPSRGKQSRMSSGNGGAKAQKETQAGSRSQSQQNSTPAGVGGVPASTPVQGGGSKQSSKDPASASQTSGTSSLHP
mmetsp:Transcript_15035/g.24898  ORF Transcript_15035/g.24898 Transcript_15035/m.24898 type:complete len:312 (+) Transcript_15035:120-1055(+)|eukprot:CAMPEP_0114452158 /NCGR_PEP_ID=MMETSP0104-20121206/1364_1 /TAXON_ID=37642 ORGANISM="Paraphysomonas imperforata, Strain PA2" /NCGR_SAMPLE_ID=MMETSP0104 /ASSEMBLY_ACC=CAM_ASM_000202 /LENGTH=311 /DNA_ID=CAMNT_0001624387 /DNA_START=64 /DNA_END=999 /DNA_ORIENTATION=-